MEQQINKQSSLKVLGHLLNAKNKDFTVFSVTFPHTKGYTDGHEILSTVRQFKLRQKQEKQYKASYVAIPIENLELFLKIFERAKYKAEPVTTDISKEFTDNITPQMLFANVNQHGNDLIFSSTMNSVTSNILFQSYKKFPQTIDEINDIHFFHALDSNSYISNPILKKLLQELTLSSFEENLKIPHISETCKMLMNMWEKSDDSGDEFGVLPFTFQISNLEQIDILASLAYGKKSSKHIKSLVYCIERTKEVQDDYVRSSEFNDSNFLPMKEYFFQNLSDIPAVVKTFEKTFPSTKDYFLSKTMNLDEMFSNDITVTSTPIFLNLKNIYNIVGQKIHHLNNDFKDSSEVEIIEKSILSTYNYILSVINLTVLTIADAKGIKQSLISNVSVDKIPENDEKLCLSAYHDGSLKQEDIQTIIKKIIPLFDLQEFNSVKLYDFNDDFKTDEKNKADKRKEIIRAVVLGELISMNISEPMNQNVPRNAESTSFKL